jgi:hypothetical protein
MPRNRPRHPFSGFGMVEIIIAILVGAVCAIPIIWMVSSSRTETSKAINYLRAMELGNEIIDLAQVVPFKDLEGFAGGYRGVLAGSGLPVKQLNAGDPWAPFVADQSLPYPEQYEGAYFFREITVEPVTTSDYGRFLKMVRVSVEWNEAKIPPLPSDNTGGNQRMRKIVLETLVFDDNNPDY